MQKGIMVSSDNLFKDYNNLENIDFVFVRAGYTDFNKSKTKKYINKTFNNIKWIESEELKIIAKKINEEKVFGYQEGLIDIYKQKISEKYL